MKRLLGATAALLVMGLSASAAILLPGQNGATPTIFNVSGLTYVSSFSGQFNGSNGSDFVANYVVGVYVGNYAGDPIGCGAAANCLTFAYQVQDVSGDGAFGNNNPTGVIEHIAGSYFRNYDTHVGEAALGSLNSDFTSHGFVDGTMAPDTVDRSSSGGGVGNTVTFNFVSPDQLSAGITSRVLLVATNATNFSGGNILAQNGTNSTLAAYGPASSAPEPATFALFGSALIGIGFLRRRAKQ